MISIIASLLATFAFANQNVPNPDLKLIETGNKTLFLSVTPPANHHLNLKTPMKANIGAKSADIAKKTPLEVLFKNKDPLPVTYNITVFLCDNENTYCVKKKITGSLSELSKESKEILTSTQTKAHTKSTKNHGALMAKKQGFIYNDWEKALEKAKKEKKPLFIDFFAIWCPPCNMLDASVFPHSKFKKLAKNYVLLKLDADSEASWKLKEKYKVAGYPTIIKASPDGTELGKIEGFAAIDSMVSFLNGVPSIKTPEEAGFNKLYDDFKAAEPNSDAQQQLRIKYLSTLDKLLNTPEEKRDLLTADILAMKASELKAIGSAEEAKKIYTDAAKAFRAQGTLAKRSGFIDRGSALEEAYCLNEAGDTTKALQIYESMEKKYPEEFTFFYAHSKLFFNKKEYSKSLPLAEKAYEYSYGDNRLRAAILLATNFLELGKKAEAENITKIALKEATVPSDPQNRTHRYLKQLHELEAKL